MVEYAPNSNKSKKEQKEKPTEVAPTQSPRKVISGKAELRKKSPVNRVFGEVFKSDIKTVASYVFWEYGLPAMKSGISDLAKRSLDMILFGQDSGPSRRKSSSPRISYVNYSDSSHRSLRDEYEDRDRRSRYYKTADFDSVFVESVGEAETVISYMKDITESGKIARVSDLYEFAGVDGDFTGYDYGWTDLSSMDWYRVWDRKRGQYMYGFKLPKAMPLNDL